MKGLTIKSYAKFNPFLSVGNIRPDGYHEVRIILSLLELHDIIKITLSEKTEIICDIPGLNITDNLIYKALKLLEECISVPPLKIEIQKNIPVQAGLGGGSSNAGAFLFAINTLLNFPLEVKDLLNIGFSLGADVPFFVLRVPTAKAECVGEKMHPIEKLKTTNVVVAKPEIGVETKNAYHSIDKLNNIHLKEFSDDLSIWQNDFDIVAPDDSKRIMKKMRELGSENVILCGSGSAVIAEFNSEADSKEAHKKLAPEVSFCWVGKTINSVEEIQWIV